MAEARARGEGESRTNLLHPSLDSSALVSDHRRTMLASTAFGSGA
jgi:hypothetical protein